MVNITIDFKNNKVYLRKPYIKGGAYKLSIDPADKLIKVIQTEVSELLATALESFSKCNTMYAVNEYIQYDYNRDKHSGFLKLIKDGKEIIHLSIFTGKKSSPHLTFSNTEGEIIHIYLADLEINDFNGGIKTTYANLLKKYNGFNDFKSICSFFYDLLNLINVKLDYIAHRDLIKQYYTQLKYYINAFMNILANPGHSKIYKGKYLENKQTTLTNMMDDDEFIAIMNREINEKKERIINFVKRNNGRIIAFNSLITEFIEKNSLNNVIEAIKKYKSYNSFPITDNLTNPFSYTEVFQNKANIDAFIKEFEEIKDFVEAVQLSTAVNIESTIMDQYNSIVDSVDSINVIFNKGTHSKLHMIVNIKEKDLQITPNQAYALKRFIDTCKNNNKKLYEKLDEDNTVANKIKESAKSETKTSPPAQTSPTQTAQTRTSPRAQTRTSPRAQTRTSPRAQTKTSPGAQTSPTQTAQTRTSPRAQTNPSPTAQTRTSPRAQTSPTQTAQTRTSPRAQTNPSPRAQTRTSPRAQTNPIQTAQTKKQSKKSKKKK